VGVLGSVDYPCSVSFTERELLQDTI
jgi:hypothetical protein